MGYDDESAYFWERSNDASSLCVSLAKKQKLGGF